MKRDQYTMKINLNIMKKDLHIMKRDQQFFAEMYLILYMTVFIVNLVDLSIVLLTL